MAITIRDAGRAPVKRNIASLVGGFVIAGGCFVLWLLVASELTALTWPVMLCGLLVALAIGVWIRVADL